MRSDIRKRPDHNVAQEDGDQTVRCCINVSYPAFSVIFARSKQKNSFNSMTNDLLCQLRRFAGPFRKPRKGSRGAIRAFLADCVLEV